MGNVTHFTLNSSRRDLFDAVSVYMYTWPLAHALSRNCPHGIDIQICTIWSIELITNAHIQFIAVLLPFQFPVKEDRYFTCNLVKKGTHLGDLPTLGRAVGGVVKALDSQPRDRGLESRRTLSLLYLESMSKICTRDVLRFTQP